MANDKQAFAAQRLAQLTTDSNQLEAEIKRLEHRMTGLQRQYLVLAHRHKFEDLDPIGAAIIPRNDEAQTTTARRYWSEGWAARALGAIVTGWISLGSFNAEMGILSFFGGTAVALLLSKIVVGITRSMTDAGPHNPDAVKPVSVCVTISGTFVVVSGGILAWLRLASNDFLGAHVALWIVAFELSLFCLGGMFECLASVYEWSSHLSSAFEELRAKRDALQTKLAPIAVEVQELAFQCGRQENNRDEPGPERAGIEATVSRA